MQMSAARAVLLGSFREKAWGSSCGFCRVELAFYTRDNEQWDSTGSLPAAPGARIFSKGQGWAPWNVPLIPIEFLQEQPYITIIKTRQNKSQKQGPAT